MGASQRAEPCRAGSRTGGCHVFFAALHFISFHVSFHFILEPVPLLTQNSACRWGSGSAHRHLPAVSLSTHSPGPSWPCQAPPALLPLLPARGHCGLSPPAGRAGFMAPLQLAVPSLSSLFLLCCGNVTQATFSSSSPRSAWEKEVFISSGFAFNSQRSKISFKSIRKAPRKHCVVKDASFQLFSVKSNEKTAKLMFSGFKGFVAQH